MRLLSSNPVLAVHDLQRSSAWYREVLGCTIEAVGEDEWSFCHCGDVTIMIGRCPDEVEASEIGLHAYIAYLHVDDVDAFHRRALAAGAQIEKAPTDEPWGL